MIIDIHSQFPGHAGNLSNLANHPFLLNGIYYGSMEGFLQSLRVKDVEMQKEVAAMHGIKAKMQGQYHIIKNDTMYYKGVPFNRFSTKYPQLVAEAYDKCFAQNESFQMSIYATRKHTLRHSIGKSDATQTILTENEFLGNLLGLKYKYADYLERNYKGFV